MPIPNELEADILRDADKTERDIFYCVVKKDISRMVYQQVHEAIKDEVQRKLEEHKDELRTQVDKLVTEAIAKMNISIPSLTLTLSASEADYE